MRGKIGIGKMCVQGKTTKYWHASMSSSTSQMVNLRLSLKIKKKSDYFSKVKSPSCPEIIAHGAK